MSRLPCFCQISTLLLACLMPRARIIKATNLRLFLLNLIVLKSKYLKVTLTKRTKYYSLS
ncbi:hypothetical protein CSUNSWCD_831 [Campylobacter showae CSUNSWCD]|uniref:Uncharacterized protein n=1 Tax=Campylobacter showae CSUNSWCD TaxID=1244083 RepID=M5II64_9BACT|nr:hypothetical protein CSUNSWCD_831 [Campylobacter showae CSUNSWCD]